MLPRDRNAHLTRMAGLLREPQDARRRAMWPSMCLQSLLTADARMPVLSRASNGVDADPDRLKECSRVLFINDKVPTTEAVSYFTGISVVLRANVPKQGERGLYTVEIDENRWRARGGSAAAVRA